MNNRLYVGNLNFSATEDDLRDLFGPYGSVQKVNIITDAYSGRSRGFAFVEMDTDASADKAIQALNGKPFQERDLVVNVARPMKKSGGGPPRDGGGFKRNKPFGRY